jgi:flagellin
MLAIKNNMMAQNAARHLGQSYDTLSTSVERLSSGLRINSAKDDAAGLAVRELIRADVASLQQGARNARDGVSMLQAAEGALGEVDNILIRMRELCEQAATDTYSETQKSLMQAEFDELAKEITRIAETTDFNAINLLNSSSGSVKIGLGSGVSSTDRCITVAKTDLRAVSLGLMGSKTTAEADTGNAMIVTATDANVLVNAETNDQTLSFTFGTATLDLTFTAGETLTITEVKNQLNAESNAVDPSWDVAEVVEDDGNYYLRLTAMENGATDFSTTNTGDNIEWTAPGNHAVADSDFTETTGVAEPDITAGDDVAMELIEDAIQQKDAYRARLGYFMNRLEYASSVLDVQAENLMTAESRISDVDVALEMTSMTRNQVLAQAGVSMLAQANSMPQMALRLLE